MIEIYFHTCEGTIPLFTAYVLHEKHNSYTGKLHILLQSKSLFSLNLSSLIDFFLLWQNKTIVVH